MVEILSRADAGPAEADAAVRADLRSRMGQTIEEGLRQMEQALKLDPVYDDAMAYLNLLCRERADLYDTTPEYQRDVVIADGWVQRALDTKKAKATPGVVAGIHRLDALSRSATASSTCRIVRATNRLY